MDPADKSRLIENYRQLLQQHGEGPAVGQWSAEGQRFRFDKLAQIANLRGSRVLDIGCGIGDLYPYLNTLYGNVDYTGVDIVPELISCATDRYASARFLCIDLMTEPFPEQFDYALISGVFNNDVSGPTDYLKQLVRVAFGMCARGVAFNFTSNRVNWNDAGMAYHDPVEVFRFCLDNLSRKVALAHHYERCDVAVYVYRQDVQ
jgi:SAM-dependent methyltransferase